MVVAIAVGVLSLFGETDEIGKAVAKTFAGKTAVVSGAASDMEPMKMQQSPEP